eukprot:gnl/Spiro4/16224_TR8713_c0_g1_i2.p1 gnl/Spiro4/16224_TR8713_c0_g1~~gnl/Spiro4/16224_TR8713_c0_g1_i2.p1  ORF type:complete len:173 (+),score=34.92 gnl/Spiro4/16224_TR8713_c0_g1_i2:197-715(+)
MWMTDKETIQAEVAQRITKLLHEFGDATHQILFLRTFFETMKREWPQIDHHRLDKFYMLVRRMTEQAWTLLDQCGWNPSTVTELMAVFSDNAFGADGPAAAGYRGLRLHMADVFLTSLAVVCPSPPASCFPQVLEPCFKMLSTCRDQSVFSRVKQAVFDALASSEETPSKRN